MANQMADIALRGRVTRLLSSEFRPDDLAWLFLALRDRSYGRETVVEIGDFVAHQGERKKGIMTQDLRDWVTVLRFHMPTIKKEIHLADLPENFPLMLRATFRRLDSPVIKKNTGLKRQVAEKVLTALIKRMTPSLSGRISFDPVNEQELSLIACLTSYIISKPAFSEDRLFNEFRDALLKNRLLEANETRAFSQLKSAISLFTVSVMHQCAVKLKDGTTAMLMAYANCDAGRVEGTKLISPNDAGSIGVHGAAEITGPNRRKLVMSSPVFITSLSAADYCEPALQIGRAPWGHAIELTSAKKLARLG